MSNRAMPKLTPVARPVMALSMIVWCSTVLGDHNDRGRTSTGEVGDALQYALPATVLAASMANKDWEGSRQFSYGLATVLASTYVLKSAVSKERPDRRDDEGFPSGHTAVSMHAAAYVHERYGMKWGLPAYLVAGYVGHSRIHDDRHDEIDVLAGAVLGFVAARWFTTTIGAVEVRPSLGEGYAGLTLTVTP